jgi:hypothetical protein
MNFLFPFLRAAKNTRLVVDLITLVLLGEEY